MDGMTQPPRCAVTWAMWEGCGAVLAGEPKCRQGTALRNPATGAFYACTLGAAAPLGTGANLIACPPNHDCTFDGRVHGCCPARGPLCPLSPGSASAGGGGRGGFRVDVLAGGGARAPLWTHELPSLVPPTPPSAIPRRPAIHQLQVLRPERPDLQDLRLSRHAASLAKG